LLHEHHRVRDVAVSHMDEQPDTSALDPEAHGESNL
jgi:hypothetical protein